MITLVLPPLTQLNTPYPAIPYLSRCLRRHGIEHTLRDFGLELFLRLFSEQGLTQVFEELEGKEDLPDPAWQALALRRQHQTVIEPVIRFLQGKDRSLAQRVLSTPFLPTGPRLKRARKDAFGPLSSDDAARHLCTLYLEDLADLVTSCIDEGFGLARYQHHLGVGPCSYDPLATRLAQNNLIDQMLDALADSITSKIVGISVPFPGTLYGALRIGQRIRKRGGYVVMGGGYVNTELREMEEPRIWDCVDAITYDDGEGPLLAILQYEGGGEDRRHRTRTKEGFYQHPAPDIPTEFAAWYQNLPLQNYLQLVDSLNPAHRLWSDGRWNKITLAHGCYWKKCSFCDIQLDYIADYRPHRAAQLADAMAELSAVTGSQGFHCVDEAAPPRIMRDLALELLKRGQIATWWGNIRFDTAFTQDVCRLLAASGLVAVTGGLEVASDRLLERMKKGVTIEQVARVARAFRQAGVLVHAYLMYGFPTQTVQETVDAMEVVRQMFAEGVLSSAFWHRFVLTRHSDIYPHPQHYGVEIIESPNSFARNDLEHRDLGGANHDRFDDLLPLALESWKRGEELDRPVHTWGKNLPPTTEKPDRIKKALQQPDAPRKGRVLWLGGEVLSDEEGLILHTPTRKEHLRLPMSQIETVGSLLTTAHPSGEPVMSEEVSLPGPLWRKLQALGLIVV